jgi:CHAT domain-containing protein
VLDPDTLLLEYALGREKSYLWAVTPTSIESFELPKREEVEKAAQSVYKNLIARSQPAPGETPEQRRRRLDLADAEYPKASAALSQMLLGPVASHLATKRLLIVSDGMLQYVPFAALPLPAAGPRPSPLPSAYTPLVVEHEVISLPSASVLTVLRQETAGRKAAAKTIAVLADPVFQSNDPRVGQSNDPRIRASASGRSVATEEIASSADARRSAAESGLDGFVRLRFSRQEADEIRRLVPGDRSLEALDFAASRMTVIGAGLDQYRIVHFATHGLINNQHPELSGIVLSLVDEQGRPQNGFLRLYEIYNLKLGADLVVLSACQTAMGKEIKGEGLVGLTRGFMYAGAPRVVASLWQIDDRATAELMKRFYQGMLGEGLRPAAALRAAQVSMWKDTRWQAPHYWAAFTFQGEWK